MGKEFEAFVKEYRKNIASNTTKYRLMKKMTKKKLAELSGLTSVLLTRVEKSDSPIEMETLYKLAFGLNIPVSFLLENPDADYCDMIGNFFDNVKGDEKTYINKLFRKIIGR